MLSPSALSWTVTCLSFQVLLAASAPQPLDSLSDLQVNDVKARLAQGALLSWELGTRAQALLELDAPNYSVFSPNRPIPQDSSSSISDVMVIARNVVRNQTMSAQTNSTTTTTSRITSTSTTSSSSSSSSSSPSPTQISGPRPLMRDDSAADPASIGPAVLLAAWTDQRAQDGLDYMAAATNQLAYLYSSAVPKTPDGAISHRVSEVQLWSDFVYMVPPFLAHYGVQTNNETLIKDAYEQIRLYRSYLIDKKADNLWKHVVLGSGRQGYPGNDEGHWATGNAWAAAGMLRVLATIKYSNYSDSFKNEQADLVAWTNEIHKAMYSHIVSPLNQFPVNEVEMADNPSSPPQDSTHIFTNYVTIRGKGAQPSGGNNGSFHDAASTALLAATVYRIALLADQYHYLPSAELSRKALYSVQSNGSMVHFTSDGWLTPVVNPHWYGAEGEKSPEGQAFVLMMHAAHKEWVQDGSKGANSGRRLDGSDGRMLWALVAVVVSGLWIIL
ncbi:hypothetical protein V5O48_006197 [Marasmius crinis-equi]|uniref:Glycoside hydrolase family 105 protein n=1 Tax=Marasmius crinis-equi TaxID=585013 RepID=A0ABR3FK59_9AGAR